MGCPRWPHPANGARALRPRPVSACCMRGWAVATVPQAAEWKPLPALPAAAAPHARRKSAAATVPPSSPTSGMATRRRSMRFASADL